MINGEDPLRRRYLRQFKIGIGVLVLLAIPAIIHSQAAIHSLFNRPADWVPDSLPEKAEFNDFLAHFSVADLVMVGWEDSDLDSTSLATVTAILQPLCIESYDAESDASTIAELSDEAAQWIAAVRLMCDTPTPLHWAQSGTETLDHLMSSTSLTRESAIKRLQGTLIGPDASQTCLVISLDEAGLTKRRFLIPEIRLMAANVIGQTPREIAVVGGPFEGAVVDTESIRSIQMFSPPSAIVAAILCLLCLRSIPLTASIVAVAVIGEGLVLAAVYYTGTPMNAVLIVLPPLVFVLTVSAGIHLSNYYLDIVHEFPEVSLSDAAKRAMHAGMAPCALATGTTVIGLSSLMLVRLQPVRVFGGVASIGVTLTLLLLFLILPGAMVLTKPRRSRTQGGSPLPPGSNHGSAGGLWAWRDRLRSKAAQWMRRRLTRPWPMIILFLTVAGGLSIGLGRLESSVNVPRMFLPDSDIRQQYAWFESHIGPTVNGELLLTFPPLTEDDDPLQRLSTVARAHSAAIAQDSVGGALSAMTFVPPISSRRSLSAAAQRSVVRKLIRDPESSLGELGFISHNPDREIWRISVRMPQSEEDQLGEQIAGLESAVHLAIADAKVPAKVSFSGGIVIVHKSQEVLLRDLFRSFVAAFGVIAIVMMLMLRSVVGGLIAMIPNLFPTVALFGLMGLIRLPLDIGSVMSASVALGIAVDDTVHLLSRYGSRRARGLGQIRAAFGALSQCGWAMFQTTLVCGTSLMAYWFSDFVPTSNFSLFMFGLLASALLGVVFLLPAMMSSVLGRWLAHTIGADASASVYADGPPNQTPPSDVRRLPLHHEQKRT
ncbi:MMPL family protein [Rubripirellula lacrimiformis]|uniref:MMPL family protein n=1 Tax=Rubripirellula lacrimiformis TaxID=1930273 RepID=A0A517NH61_9BACT|nr:MMPL family transporter [Rubripirellula lacrimiformis]QDT06393.1 MMPL family protein [Rubripirellula lacrimiformis]